MAEQELNLFKLASCRMTQPCASPAQIVRSQIVNARELCIFTYDPPDGFLAEAIAPSQVFFAGPAPYFRALRLLGSGALEVVSAV
jgi:hypothetical protein